MAFYTNPINMFGVNMGFYTNPIHKFSVNMAMFAVSGPPWGDFKPSLM